jgi:hypothetical protein
MANILYLLIALTNSGFQRKKTGVEFREVIMLALTPTILLNLTITKSSLIILESVATYALII